MQPLFEVGITVVVAVRIFKYHQLTAILLKLRPAADILLALYNLTLAILNVADNALIHRVAVRKPRAGDLFLLPLFEVITFVLFGLSRAAQPSRL